MLIVLMLIFIMLIVVMLIVIMLIVIMLIVIMLIDIMLIVIMLIVVMLIVVMLSVVMPIVMVPINSFFPSSQCNKAIYVGKLHQHALQLVTKTSPTKLYLDESFLQWQRPMTTNLHQNIIIKDFWL